MKQLFLFSALVGSFLFFNSCSDNENDDKKTDNKVLVKWDGSGIGEEVLNFEYNDKNQLIYFTESGKKEGVYVIKHTYRLLYDAANKLIELRSENLTGTTVYADTTKYAYYTDHVVQTHTTTDPRNNRKDTIYIDTKGRLSTKPFGKVKNEYFYDTNDNLTKINFTGSEVTEYEYDDMKSIFSNQKNLPLWFWVDYLDGLEMFAGKNNCTKFTEVGDSISIKYEYDKDGYPTKAIDAVTNKVYTIFTYKIID